MKYCSIDGILQGSSLGTILFLVYINDVSNALEHSETNLFADDTNLTCAIKITSEALLVLGI